MAEDIHNDLDLDDGEWVAGSYLASGEVWSAPGVIRVQPSAASEDIETITVRLQHSEDGETWADIPMRGSA